MVTGKLYKTAEAAKALNISVSTVKKWVKEGKIKAIRVGKLWMIPESEIRRILSGKKDKIRAVIYARVSSHKQKADRDLDRQIERLRSYCSARGYIVVDIITDVASGLDENREGLKRLIEMAINKQMDVIVVEFKDRLTRFGFEYLRKLFETHSVAIEVVEESGKGYMEELVEDFISIVTSFAARIYGERSQKFKKIREVLRGVEGSDG
ncbi:MAG TPA: IS607 family transposase [Sulfolobales archaeon]|nr:IS607 family transposase [Sulfolobales archaeon]